MMKSILSSRFAVLICVLAHVQDAWSSADLCGDTFQSKPPTSRDGLIYSANLDRWANVRLDLGNLTVELGHHAGKGITFRDVHRVIEMGWIKIPDIGSDQKKEGRDVLAIVTMSYQPYILDGKMVEAAHYSVITVTEGAVVKRRFFRLASPPNVGKSETNYGVNGEYRVRQLYGKFLELTEVLMQPGNPNPRDLPLEIRGGGSVALLSPVQNRPGFSFEISDRKAGSNPTERYVGFFPMILSNQAEKIRIGENRIGMCDGINCLVIGRVQGQKDSKTGDFQFERIHVKSASPHEEWNKLEALRESFGIVSGVLVGYPNQLMPIRTFGFIGLNGYQTQIPVTNFASVLSKELTGLDGVTVDRFALSDDGKWGLVEVRSLEGSVDGNRSFGATHYFILRFTGEDTWKLIKFNGRVVLPENLQRPAEKLVIGAADDRFGWRRAHIYFANRAAPFEILLNQ